MGEHKTPKLTVTLELTLLERLVIHSLVRAPGLLKIADRDDERALNRAWDVLDLDAVAEWSEVPVEASDTATITRRKAEIKSPTTRSFECDAAHLKWLAERLPLAQSGEQARVLGPVRDKIDKARESLK